MSKTIHTITPGVPLLTARLVSRRTGRTRRPALFLEFWSPTGHDYISTPVPDDYRPEGVVPVKLVPALPGDPEVYAVADPAHDREHRGVLSSFRAALRAWRVEQRLAGRLVPSPHYLDAPMVSTTDWVPAT